MHKQSKKNYLLNDMLEKSDFRILRCLFWDEGVVLEQNYTRIIKSYLLQAIF